jgi:hypothetical protein
MKLTAVQEAARLIGSKGGQAGTGASKRRSKAHYARLAAIKRKKAKQDRWRELNKRQTREQEAAIAAKFKT